MHDFERIATVIRYLDKHQDEQPDLAELADQVKLSPHHFHRLFSTWVGATPKDFLQCLTVERAKSALRLGHDTLGTALEAGLSGPGRLHDLCVTLEGASPGEIKSGGAGWTITAGFAPTPFGECLLAEGPRGLCFLAFVQPIEREATWQELQKEWPQATLRRNDKAAQIWAKSIFAPEGKRPRSASIKAFVRGTPFQLKVWRALLRIPSGQLVTYGDIAEAIDHPHATRAVGTAVGSNPISFLIPCHRVIRSTGVIGEYRWGHTRKQALVAWELAK